MIAAAAAAGPTLPQARRKRRSLCASTLRRCGSGGNCRLGGHMLMLPHQGSCCPAAAALLLPRHGCSLTLSPPPPLCPPPCSLQGWQTARGFTYLRRPLEASMKLTPALGRCACCRVLGTAWPHAPPWLSFPAHPVLQLSMSCLPLVLTRSLRLRFTSAVLSYRIVPPPSPQVLPQVPAPCAERRRGAARGGGAQGAADAPRRPVAHQ